MAADLRKIHALIADQDRYLRELLRGSLRELGLPLENIRQCGSGADALEYLRIRQADFLIAGQQMQPIDGLALIRVLRDPTRTPAPGIPIIFCSAGVDLALLDTLYAAGVNEILVTPFNAQAINSRVTSVLERPRPIVRTATYVGPDTGGPRNESDKDDDRYWTIC
jgi:two-component system, chemotaxis family, chemotaxis protein CheY